MRFLSLIFYAAFALTLLIGEATAQELKSPNATAPNPPAAAKQAPASTLEAEHAGMRAQAVLTSSTQNVVTPASELQMRMAALSPALAAASPPVPNLAKTPAKDLFGAVKEPANLAAKAVGFYAKGCLAGGQPLPIDGPAWQAMRLSRNRNWGHPTLIRFLERFAEEAKEKDGWPGLLVGDMSLPRGGPMPFGHASHQVGLDVDIWYKPMPDHVLSAEEREQIPMESFLLDPGHINPAMWSPDYIKLLRRAASYPEVARIFVNPAIKKWLCDNTKDDRKFLRKLTPIGGHDDHFHVRLVCPPDNPGCQNQALPGADEGCGKGLDKWIDQLVKAASAPRPAKPASPPKPKPPLLMSQLPAECKTVLEAAPRETRPVTAAK
ncbi:MAG TPA: penicillin-insensitive murein endopeptidase [Hyphomicrobiales bacterium]|nr:penicillin-insensitive murein endopeptidase [Hyphomicrobiales bacterium]